MSSRYYSKRQGKKRPKKGEGPPPKPKAFKSEAAAKAWTEKHGLNSHTVDQISEKKFKVRAKD
ncbi:MAG: hypothetical protein V1729_02390 [Candidatus Woesearchaeota archaeon]